MPLPDFLIIGECKCGTTSMYDNLLTHPKVLPTLGNGENITVDADVPLGVKEIRFFDKHYNKGWDWYKNCFPKCPTKYITGEASPTYFYRETAIRRALSVLPNIKLIIMLRNPTDRLVSHYDHLKRIHTRWAEKYPTLDHYWTGCTDGDYHLIDRGLYSKSLTGLRNYTGNAHIIKAEDMWSQPQETFSKLLEFLELSDIELKSPRHSRKGDKKKKSHTGHINDINDFYSKDIKITEAMLGRKLWT